MMVSLGQGLTRPDLGHHGGRKVQNGPLNWLGVAEALTLARAPAHALWNLTHNGVFLPTEVVTSKETSNGIDPHYHCSGALVWWWRLLGSSSRSLVEPSFPPQSVHQQLPRAFSIAVLPT